MRSYCNGHDRTVLDSCFCGDDVLLTFFYIHNQSMIVCWGRDGTLACFWKWLHGCPDVRNLFVSVQVRESGEAVFPGRMEHFVPETLMIWLWRAATWILSCFRGSLQQYLGCALYYLLWKVYYAFDPLGISHVNIIKRKPITVYMDFKSEGDVKEAG